MTTPPSLRHWALPALLAAAFALPAAAGAVDSETAQASFDRFAATWMGKMNRDAAAPSGASAVRLVSSSGADVTYRGYADEFHTELRPTGDSSVPFVGILHYTERLYRCSGPGRTGCSVVESSPVTEFFPYEGGRWKY